MKKIIAIAFCVLLLCSTLLIGTTLASEPGYAGILENYTGSPVTIDGKWTSSTEWADAWNEHQYPSGINARFMYKMSNDDAGYYMTYLLEFPDTTNDPGDKWVICIDGGAGEGPDGGTAPKTDDNKIEITGHTTVMVYDGNGTGWAPASSKNSAVRFNNTLTTSAYIPTNHWVCEIIFNKYSIGAWGQNAPPQGLFVGMYDASNTTGSALWPAPATDSNPSRWGTIATFGTEVPEGLSFAVVVALSSVAIVVGTIYLRKKPKTTILAPVKL